MTENVPSTLAAAREEFLALVSGIRPELHRYCARLTGSVIDGEDIVQDTLAKALYALSQSPEMPPLRPWLFRIAHNAAMDFLKSHGHSLTEPRADFDDVAGSAAGGTAQVGSAGWEDAPDPAIVRAALARFVALPVTQRSAVVLKDVLGHSLEETAETMGTTVMAVKAALVRGRKNLSGDRALQPTGAERADLDKYVTLFNARDWDGVRAMIAGDCKLDLVSKSQRRGKQVGMYFSNYEKERFELRVIRVDGRVALGVYASGAEKPAYFMLLDFEDGRVKTIRDFRYVPYIAREAEITSV
ncbi:MAG TPA: sigma-70 family RNA polymerase sigma factor [Polyangiaceae bacterium]|nr:sigma-70 family RNA polymerase sigma factor [Polyangiaceae bacterium]